MGEINVPSHAAEGSPERAGSTPGLIFPDRLISFLSPRGRFRPKAYVPRVPASGGVPKDLRVWIPAGLSFGVPDGPGQTIWKSFRIWSNYFRIWSNYFGFGRII